MSSTPPDLPRPAAASADAAPPYVRIHGINIYVRDQDRALDFYLRKLGFQLAFDARLQNGQRWVAVAPPEGNTVLVLIAPRRNTPEYKLIGRATHVVFVTEDVIARVREWSGRGVRFLGAPRLNRIKYDEFQTSRAEGVIIGKERPVWGGAVARFRDADGNTFALFSFDEITHSIEAQRRAAQERAEQERRAAQELEIAKQVQSRLFPQTRPPLSGLDYAGMCIQARQVGGDYYDFLPLGEGRLGLVIGDISGKGIAAALLMANLQANLRSQCAIAVDEPQRMLRAVNHLFCQSTTDGAFATLFFAEYEDSTGRLRYANCGHHPALLLRRGGAVERLSATTTVLGIFDSWDCAIAERQLQPGDTLALYTDGITEARDDAEEEFGEERLAAALEAHAALEPGDLLRAVVADVRRHSPREQQDDITLIIARRR